MDGEVEVRFAWKTLATICFPSGTKTQELSDLSGFARITFEPPRRRSEHLRPGHGLDGQTRPCVARRFRQAGLVLKPLLPRKTPAIFEGCLPRAIYFLLARLLFTDGFTPAWKTTRGILICATRPFEWVAQLHGHSCGPTLTLRKEGRKRRVE